MKNAKMYVCICLICCLLFTSAYADDVFYDDENQIIDPGYNVLLDYVTAESLQEVRVYLRDALGYNSAVTSGILANMVYESKLDPTRYGDKYASYGICQWNDERQDLLKDFAEEYDASPSELYLQLMFFGWEMRNYYPELYDYLLNLPDSDFGASCAASVICKQYEVPKGMTQQVEKRKYAAIWDYVYGSPDGESYVDVWNYLYEWPVLDEQTTSWVLLE